MDLEKTRAWNRKSYQKHKAKRLDAHREWFKKNPEKRKQYTKAGRDRRKLAALNAYGGPTCVICGQTELSSLSLDHINGDGHDFRSHFKIKMSGDHFYRWLRRNDYPANLNLRVLCKACNHKAWRKQKVAIQSGA